jgi:hypothetical protein
MPTTKRYNQARPSVSSEINRHASIEAGHACSVAHCGEHTYLELHHINGNREDNRIENVILLCDKHHKMAHAGVIDREALREYKRLNREHLGLNQTYTLSDKLRSDYLQRLASWLAQEQERLETSILANSAKSVHIPPLIRHNGKDLCSKLDDATINVCLKGFIFKHRSCMLLGNGGSGKTVALISWLRDICNVAFGDEQQLIPVFVSLHRVTQSTTLLDAIKVSVAQHGLILTDIQLEALLAFGRFCVVLDGLNEINKNVADSGALQDIANFIDSHPESIVVASSRYTPVANDWNVEKLEIAPWDDKRIEKFLQERLGETLGSSAYKSLGDKLDFEWLSGCSIAGLCSNPFTLSMLATFVEEKQLLPSTANEIVEFIVSKTTAETIKRTNTQLVPRIMREVLENFAYSMVSQGYVISVSYEIAVKLIAEILRANKDSGLIPSGYDGYQFLGNLIQTGIIQRPFNDRIEWLHQVLQEKLSISFSARHFGEAIKLCELVRCPICGYNPREYYEKEDQLWGHCEGSEDCGDFLVELPSETYSDQLGDKLAFIDHTGAVPQEGMVSIPNSYMDERWFAFMPIGALYHIALSFSQNKTIGLVSKNDFLSYMNQPRLLINLEVLALEKAGILELEYPETDMTVVHVNLPPVNPSFRLVGYELRVLREMSLDELEESPDERFGITSDRKEAYLEERRKKNLPIFHTYSFVEDDKARIFRIALRFGGQVLRSWGPYQEIVAEFPGEAWDFSGYSTKS